MLAEIILKHCLVYFLINYKIQRAFQWDFQIFRKTIRGEKSLFFFWKKTKTDSSTLYPLKNRTIWSRAVSLYTSTTLCDTRNTYRETVTLLRRRCKELPLTPLNKPSRKNCSCYYYQNVEIVSPRRLRNKQRISANIIKNITIISYEIQKAL